MNAGWRTMMTLSVCLSLLAAAGADWPGFRGPGSLGVSSDKNLPVHWGLKDNIAWKIKLPGPGSSCPIVWKDRVFLTCYTGYGLVKGKGGDVKDLRRHLLCVDRKTGRLLWQKEVAAKLPENDFTSFITEHGYATNTPVTDGERVYVFFGRSGVLAFNHDGRLLWQKEVGKGLNGWGSAASPVLYGNLVIVNASVEAQALVALDKRTGLEVWRAKDVGDCWSTPLLVTAPGGQVELVQNTSDELLGFDPNNGKPLWSCAGAPSATASSTPVTANGIVYAMGAANAGGRTLLAVRAGGRGDVTNTHVLWKKKIGTNHCSPVLYRDHLWWVSGQAVCVKAATGEVVFQKRLYEVRMEYVSPVAGDGKIIAFTRRNGAYVLAAKTEFELLAHNELGDASNFNASPAVSDGQLLVRSNEYLYCIGTGR